MSRFRKKGEEVNLLGELEEIEMRRWIYRMMELMLQDRNQGEVHTVAIQCAHAQLKWGEQHTPSVGVYK